MNKLSPWILVAAALFSAGAMAQMDVDEADSLNFQDFHKDKKEAIKVWQDGIGQRSETIKTYEAASPAATPPGTTATDTSSITSTVAKPAAASASAPAAAKPQTEAKSGLRYEIRERYTLSRSAKTPYSAFYVIEPLHKQAYQFCPRGWKKLTERSEPVEQDFYLYFEVECL